MVKGWNVNTCTHVSEADVYLENDLGACRQWTAILVGVFPIRHFVDTRALNCYFKDGDWSTRGSSDEYGLRARKQCADIAGGEHSAVQTKVLDSAVEGRIGRPVALAQIVNGSGCRCGVAVAASSLKNAILVQ